MSRVATVLSILIVTLRAVEGDVVRELGESQVLKIGKKPEGVTK